MGRPKLNDAMTGLMVICAIFLTGLVARRELFPPQESPPQPVYVEKWREALNAGISMGSDKAPVQLIEFADFECPFCASYLPTLEAVRQRHGAKVAVTFAHFPLQVHKSAESSARAAECAHVQGRFEPMQAFLFERQKSLAQITAREMATGAGISDYASFESCITSNESSSRVSAIKQLGESFGVEGTPTILLNGWRLKPPPSSEELDRMIVAVLKGQDPVQQQGFLSRLFGWGRAVEAKASTTASGTP